jgi:hypothetical protein
VQRDVVLAARWIDTGDVAVVRVEDQHGVARDGQGAR